MIICESCGIHTGMRHLAMCKFVYDPESMTQKMLGKGIFQTKFKERRKEPSFSEWLYNRKDVIPRFDPASWGTK